MRIGILTFHIAQNYGAVLQCYALQEYLKSRGHKVYVINYKNQYIVNDYKPFNQERFIRKNPVKMLKLFFKELKLYSKKRKRHIVFNNFINTYLNIAPIESITKEPYDMIFIGSDQVWNFHLTRGFDDYYWGKFERPSNTKLCSFAASMQDDWNEEESILINRYLKNFDYISIREKSTAEKIRYLLSDKQIYQVTDPTLLLNKLQWSNISIKPKLLDPYLLVYQVEPHILSEKIAYKISIERNLRIIRLSANVSDINDSVVVSSSPSEFIGLFQHASFVVCSSFHGTIFSLQFKKNFYSVQGIGKNARVQTLLSDLKLEDRFVSKCPSLITDINYSSIDLNSINNKTKDFIKYLEDVK